jgi:hypothetical protein
VIDYHGKRAAYYVDARELRKDLSVGYKKFLQVIENELFDKTRETRHKKASR